MKSYLGITTRYLKIQKRRTMLTILGIILSTALISGIGTIGISFLDKMLRDTISATGDYYASVNNISQDRIERIKKHVLVEKTGVEIYKGFADKKSLSNDNAVDPDFKGYNVVGYDQEALKILPIKLKEGSMPKNSNEIVIGTGTISYLKVSAKIGDNISLDITPGTLNKNQKFIKDGEPYVKQYTIVGYLDSSASYQYRNSAITLCDGNDTVANSHNTIYLKLKSYYPIKENVSKILQDVGSANTQSNISYNSKVMKLLLQSDSKTNMALIASLLFLALIVVVSMVAVIYNTFNISIFERISQYGMLRCVGATPNQIRHMVFKEATILGIIGIPVGIVLGTLVMKILFALFGVFAPTLPFGDLKLIFSPLVIVVCLILGFISVYLSALGPARKASRISPMEAVKNAGSLKKESFKKVSSAKLARLIFGAEGWMAQKNLGRNRKRLAITVFSMIISIVLFIVFSSIIDLSYKTGINDSDNEMVNFTIQNKMNIYEDVQINQDELKELKQIPGVKTVFTYYKQFYKTGGEEVLLPKDKINSQLKKNTGKWYSEHQIVNKYIKFDKSHVIALGDKVTSVLNEYIDSGSIDIDAMNKENGVIVVSTGQASNKDTKEHMILKTANLKPGDTIKIKVPEFQITGKKSNMQKYKDFKVMAVLKQGIWGEKFNEDGGINLYTTEKIYKDMTASDKTPHMILIEMKNGAETKQLKQYLQNFIQKYPNFIFNDYDEIMKEYFQSNLIISIFVYGFFLVIALIGCVNILNTISTNIILRTRELSILKAVGMTQMGIKKLICLESIFYGLIASIAGTVLGCLLSLSLYKLFYGALAIEWSIPWKYIAIAIAGTIIVTLLSGYLPLKRINNAVIMENIRGEQ